YVNPAFETIMGYRKAEVIGKELTEVPKNENKSDYIDTRNSYVKTGKEWEGICYVKGKNGEKTQHNVRIIPVFGEGG
ncbi:hypothetical protein NDU88_005604, partial [Pleurodeles waltl]